MRRSITLCLTLCASLLLTADVENTDTPAKGSWDFSQQTLWQTQRAGEDVIGGIQDIAVSGDGRIYVLDAGRFAIHVYRPDGSYRSTFGRRGEETGEFCRVLMGRQLFVVENRVVLVEPGRIHFFSLAGESVRTVPIPARLRPRAFVTTDVFLSAPETGPEPGTTEVKLVLYRIPQDRETVLTTYRPYVKSQVTHRDAGDRTTWPAVIGDITPLMLVAYRRGKVFFGMSDRYRVQVVDLKGTTLFAFSVKDRVAQPIAAAFKSELIRRIGVDRPRETMERMAAGLPEQASFFSDIHVDRRGWVLLAVSEPARLSSVVFDVFSPKGRFLYTGVLAVEEGRKITALEFWRDRAYIACEGDGGDVTLNAYVIESPR